MSTGKVVLVTMLVGSISIGLTIFVQEWLTGRDLSGFRWASNNADQLDRLPELRLKDVDGREHTSNSWAGKVLVLNFWATWCPPCLREMPMFIRAQQALGEGSVQFVGIAVDRVEDVASFLTDHPVNYPILVGDKAVIEMSRRLGNRLQGLPFTVIFDQQGRRVYSQVGEVTRDVLEQQLFPLLPSRTGEGQDETG